MKSQCSDLEMDDLKTIALSALIRKAASGLGYANGKPKQLEVVLEFCKRKDVFVSFIFREDTVLPSLRKSTNSIVVVVSPLAVLMAQAAQQACCI